MIRKRGVQASVNRITSDEKTYLYFQMKKQGFSDQQINYELATLEKTVKETHKNVSHPEKIPFKEEFEKMIRKKRK